MDINASFLEQLQTRQLHQHLYHPPPVNPSKRRKHEKVTSSTSPQDIILSDKPFRRTDFN